MLTRADLDDLARADGDALVSVYLPTHRRAVDTQGDPIRLKNALAEATRQARELGVDRRTIQALLAPGEQLLADEWFWQHQGDGLALFFGAAGMRDFRLTQPVGELVTVGRRYCVRPLLPALTAGERFYVLALSQKHVRLIRCSRTGARELDLRDIPKSLADAVGYDWEQKSLQFHTRAPRAAGGRRAAAFHGHGAAGDSAKAELTTFLRQVDDGIVGLLGPGDAPLVPAAVKFEAAAYREVSRYPALAAADLEGSPDRRSARELAEAALPLVEAHLHKDQRNALAAVEAGLATGRVVTDLETALRDAHAGRVGTLAVGGAEPVWGRHDGTNGTVEVHGKRLAGDDDLLDLCVSTALRTGASVQAVPAADLPGGSRLAAVRRF